MSKMKKDNNVTKKLSLVQRLVKYVEENAVYFANLHCICTRDYHARF